ncbi:MAG: hypothetical protein WBM40_03490 [Thiohalocapsa sp.]
MRTCKACRAAWPFAFALALAAIVSFPAWATFDLMALEPASRVAGTALVFFISATGLMLYVHWCIKRNCSLRRAMAAQRGLSGLRSVAR